MTMVLAFFFMVLIVAAMSIGVVMGRKPIAGSCGGMQNLGINGECQVCGRQPGTCDDATDNLSRIAEARRTAESLATDAAAPSRPDRRTL